VNASSAQSCADQLEAKVNIHIDIEAKANSVGESVSNAADSVSKEVDKSCSIAGAGVGTGSVLSGLAPFAAIVLLGPRRRRSKRH